MNLFQKLGAVAALATGSASTFAAGTDYTSISSAVDFTAVGTGLLAIGALMIVPKVVKWGATKVMSMVRG